MTHKPARRPRAVGAAAPARSVNVAEAKRHFSELLGQVAIGHQSILITRRGRPMARLVPIEPDREPSGLAHVRGWLDDDDPFFQDIEAIVESRPRHTPRVLGAPLARPRTRARK